MALPVTTTLCCKDYLQSGCHPSHSNELLSCLNGTQICSQMRLFAQLISQRIGACTFAANETSCALVQAAEAADRKRKAAAARVAKQNLQAQQEQIAHNPQHALPAPAGEPKCMATGLTSCCSCRHNITRCKQCIVEDLASMFAAVPEDTRPKKKARKKEYIPGVGTAGYAFLITLFQVQRWFEVLRTSRRYLPKTLHATPEAQDRVKCLGMCDTGPQTWRGIPQPKTIVRSR